MQNKFDSPAIWKDLADVYENLKPITPDSYFVYFRFTAPIPFSVECKSVYWFQSIDETAAYVKYMVRDAILDRSPKYREAEGREIDLDELYKTTKDKNILHMRRYWDGINAVLAAPNVFSALKEYLVEYNEEFADSFSDFELQVYAGIEDLKNVATTSLAMFWNEDDTEVFLKLLDPEAFKPDDLKVAFDAIMEDCC